ncbi:MAG: acyclic terpene utilization AtuA family protein, partial [Planctomycetota bacterium]
MKEKIVIANCGGFWGDDPTAAKRQVEGGPIDYLVMDYLAEVTMAILQKQKAKNPALGYAADFLAQLRDVLPQCVEKGVKVISNAGGVNPLACRDAVNALAEELGIADRVTVGVVLGDDIYPHLDEILGDEPLAHMDTGRPLSDVREDVMSANVYLGAKPVVEALKLGANVVISGRVSDTGVTLAPMIHEFGWAENDWDRIASGIVAGHIIECGTQCTGGNFTDWQLVKDHATIGYPMVEVSPDGTFVVTKHPGTGGLVSVHTVSEQLLYEMGAPAYIAPDCIA